MNLTILHGSVSFFSPVLLALAASAQSPCGESARVLSLGSGTSGSSGEPVLGLVGRPTPGQPFDLRIARARPNAFGAAYYGFSQVEFFLSQYAANVFVAPPILLATFITDADGQAVGLQPLTPLPASLCGVEVSQQAFVLDPGAVGGIAFTNGTRLRFGEASARPLYPASVQPFRTNSVPTSQNAAGDMDGDSILDLVVLEQNGVSPALRDLLVLRGIGDGRFDAPLRTTVPGGLQDPRLGDMDGNGTTDVVLFGVAPEATHVYLGVGDGTFLPPIVQPSGHGFLDSVLRDFDNDGRLDVITASGANTVSLLRGVGDGSLQPTAVVLTGAPLLSLGTADFDGDGNEDLCLGKVAPSRIAVHLGLGNGTFGTARDTLAQNSATSLLIHDLDEDGELDVLTHNSSNFSLFYGQGGGLLGPETSTTFVGTIRTASVGDLNNDGRAEVLTFHTTLLGQSGQIRVFNGFGGAPFEQTATLLVSFNGREFVVADFEGNGQLDVVASGGQAVTVHIDPGLEGHVRPLALERSSRLVRGDWNADGLVDLASATNLINGVSTFLGTGQGRFAEGGTEFTGFDLRDLAAADLDLDGDDDLVVIDRSTNVATVLTSLGDGTFGAPTSYAVGTDPISIATGDFNGDGLPDLAVGEEVAESVSILLNNGSGFGAATSMSVGGTPLRLEIGDLNGDGNVDVVTPLGTASSFAVLLGTGSGLLGTATLVPTPSVPRSIALGDVDGDAILDVVIVGTGPPSTALFLGFGDGTFSGPIALPTDSARVVGLADVTGDGFVDVVTHDDDLSVQVHPGQGNGAFDPPLSFQSRIKLPDSIVIADLDFDGALDLVVGSRASGADVILSRLLK